MKKQPKNPKQSSDSSSELESLLERGNRQEIRGLFSFDANTSEEEVLFLFNLWSRHFFPQYFKAEDAPFHEEIDTNNCRAYSADIVDFVDIAYRGAAKTTRTKLFLAFAISNDTDHFRKYIKVLTKDVTNSKQIVTDIYNMLMSRAVSYYYPEIFEKTIEKREETMASFTTATGVKVRAGTVGTDQRGQIQEDARPDLIWCHQKGTRIFDDNKWMNVEDHHSFKQYRKEKGVEVFLRGLPYSEVVTKEHRYFVKTLKPGRTTGQVTIDQGSGWKEAKDLTGHDYIGLKIDQSVVSPKLLKKYVPGVTVLRDGKGKITSSVGGFSDTAFDGFCDKEWWWFFGLFWGDGHLSTKKDTGNNTSVVAVTIANSQPLLFLRIKKLLSKYSIKYSTHQGKGCFRVQFSHAQIARWLRTWYIGGNSRKVPPQWVEQVGLDYQRSLVVGYIDSDGYVDPKGQCVRITSVCLEGLLSLRRILARLDIPSSIRHGAEGKEDYEIVGNKCCTQKKYDIRFRENVGLLGYPIANQTRYTYPLSAFIKDGYLWTKVTKVSHLQRESLFCPITTATHEYITDFGISHNCDDFETRKTLRSAIETQAIWDNMEEARTGLSKDGACIYTCNYFSERGNVHKLVGKHNGKTFIVLIVPIIKNGVPAWSIYSLEDIERIRSSADDFAGEYLCEPSAGLDILFDRASLDAQTPKEPIRVIADFKMFYPYDPSHRYGSGHDVAGGVGIDSSTSVFIDFATLPNRVVATYQSNIIKPDVFGDEINSEANRYGAPIVAVENNKFDMCIGRLKQIYDNLYFTEVKETRAGLPPKTKTYGWNTNRMTKPKMLFELKKAVEDGHLLLSDKDLIAELRSYTRDDLMDGEEDVRLTTRHFDLLMAAAIAWQMRNFAEVAKESLPVYEQPAYERSGLED